MATITIHHDRDAESPRDWDNLGVFWATDNRYLSGDDGATLPDASLISGDALRAWACSLPREEQAEIVSERRRWDSDIADAIRDYVESSYSDFSEWPESLQESIDTDRAVIIPVYAYIHGGIALNTGGFSCSWDSGQIGYIWCTMDRAREWMGADVTPERVAESLKAEIESLNVYYTQGAYGFSIEDDDGSESDSCWGFIGFDVDKNGILDHLPPEYHDAARKAMDNVGEPIEIDPSAEAA